METTGRALGWKKFKFCSGFGGLALEFKTCVSLRV